MTAALIPTPVMQFLDADGNPLVGGKVYTYAAGTSTPLATFTDYGGATPNANPVILNSRGEASIWFGTAAYKLELYTAATVLIWTADNVSASTPVVYGTGVAAALAINVGTAGSILVNGGVLGTPSSGLVTNLTGTASININGTVGATTTNTGRFTTINASGTVAMAGAATVGTTLGVTGTSTMAAINASGLITSTVVNGNIFSATSSTTGTPYALISNTSGNVVLAVDSSTGGSVIIGSTAYDGILKGQTGLSFSGNDGAALHMRIASTGAVTIPGTLGVTGAFTGTTGTFTKAAAGDVLVLTNGGATPKPMYFYSDASTMSMGTSASQGGSLLAFVSTTSAQINIGGGSVQSWTTAGTSVTGTLGVTGNVGIGGAGTTVPLTVRVGTDQNLEADSSSSTLRLSAVNNARNLNVGIIFQASAFAFNSGPVTMNNYGVGTATFNAVGLISSVSDERLKIKDGTIADPIPMMMALEPGYYFGKPEANMGDGRQLGFYAQNVRSAIGPEAAPDPQDIVTLDEDGNEVSRTTRPWGYYDRSVLAVAIEALKVHEGRLAALQAEFQAYKSSHP